MSRDVLRVLLSVRQQSVEAARYALGACLKVEADIAARIGTHEEMARRDRETSAVWEDAREFQEISARRLAAMRAVRQLFEADRAAAALRSEAARGAVAAARTAAEAVEQLIGERTAAKRVETDRRDQHSLDDIARTCRATLRRGETA